MKGIILRSIWIIILVFPICMFLMASRLDSTALHQFIEETIAVFFAAISAAFFRNPQG
jgi:hypothetical protein